MGNFSMYSHAYVTQYPAEYFRVILFRLFEFYLCVFLSSFVPVNSNNLAFLGL